MYEPISTAVQKLGVSWISNKMKIKSDICNVTNIYISNKCCPFELSIHQRILNKKKMCHGFQKHVFLSSKSSY